MSDSELRVVHTVAGLDPGYGGPSRSVVQLAEALVQARPSASVQVLTTGSEDFAASARSQHVNLNAITLRAGWQRVLRYSPEFSQRLRLLAAQSARAVVHDHGLWLPTNHVAASVARQLGVPRIVSPRGMLSDWARSHRRWKKSAAWHLYQHGDLASATALHATSAEEALEFRRAGLRQPIAIVPNGIVMPPAGMPHHGAGKKRAVVLCRLHPVKGLEELLHAWATLRPSDWELWIAGPDENGYGQLLKKMADTLGLRGLVQFQGALSDDEKWRFLSGGHLFVLPSRSESFAIVVGEALAAGLPILTTKAVPWPQLSEWGCGWQVSPGLESLTEGLRRPLSMSVQQLGSMGESGARYVKRLFSWSHLAEEQWQVYRWLLGADRPACITLD
ncbi:MAG: glycosyltransferase [Nevskiales bacterium]